MTSTSASPGTVPLRKSMRKRSGVSTTVLRKKSVKSAPALTACPLMLDQSRLLASAVF
ncbi:hypothetical protein ACVBEH_02650 [Roseateles sp. GG27B]